jgi:hypothetical protein
LEKTSTTLIIILLHLATAHRANPDAEVSGVELQAALGLDVVTARACVAELARERLVEWDPLLSNIWVRITDKGSATVQDIHSPPAAE